MAVSMDKIWEINRLPKWNTEGPVLVSCPGGHPGFFLQRAPDGGDGDLAAGARPAAFSGPFWVVRVLPAAAPSVQGCPQHAG